MFQFTSKLKIFALVLVVVGAIFTAVGFMAAPKSEAQVEQMMAKEAKAHEGHGSAMHSDHHASAKTHNGEHAHSDTDAYHVYHQLKNRPWAAFYAGALFFFFIGLGALAFLAIQKAAQAGWSPVLFRVMEGISAYILPGGIVILIILFIGAFHGHHLFHWMDSDLVDPKSPKYDALIAGKTGFLNIPFFLARACAFIIGWNIYRWNIRKFSLKQDKEPAGNVWYKKGFKHSAAFLVFFIVTESIMSWDWIMSLDPHWFSTLFGWYVFASMFVSGITAIALFTIFLKGRGYLEIVNNSHIHDLAKFMFGISIFWTYLWFSQFMLIWYANIPEEVTYFVTRIQDYTWLFWGMVALNFLFPLLMLMNSDFKRINWFVVTTGIVIFIGHYLNMYVMVMPATVGKSWFIGFPEIGALLLFAGIFIFTVLSAFAKAPLVVQEDPYLGESKHFHY